MTETTDHNPGGENPIDGAAADWTARLDRGALSAADAALFEAWLAADVRHRGAFARAQAAFATLDRARALGAQVTAETLKLSQDAASWAPPAWTSQVANSDTPRASRRAVLAGGAAAGIALAAVFGRDAYTRFFPRTPPQVYTSKKGEIKLVSLTDESVLTLNTHSLVSVDYTADRRGVELTDGEVIFAVAKEAARPFSVLAGDLEVRAVGTSFMVRHMAGRPVEVLVQEGVVDVVYRTQPGSLVRAAANTRVTADGMNKLTKAAVSAATMARETAWRQGMIAFEGVSLATAAAEFSRYSETRIVIDDVTIATTTITGLFEANNPAGFSQAVAGSLGLKVDVGPGFVRLYQE